MPAGKLAADAVGDPAALRREIEARGGRVVDAHGDSVVAHFEAPADGLKAALAAQRDGMRIGIHLDDATVAMGLRASAIPGGICISQALYDAVKDKAVFQAQFGGKKAFKNMRGPMGIWHVADVNAELHLPDSAAAAAAPSHKLHRFLPFAVIAAMILAGAVAWWWIAHASKEAARVSLAVYSRPCAS
jgi:class 3 adenylate cyclase